MDCRFLPWLTRRFNHHSHLNLVLFLSNLNNWLVADCISSPFNVAFRKIINKKKGLPFFSNCRVVSVWVD